MAVLNKRSRKEIRRSIGYNLGAVTVGTTTDSGTAGQVIDATNLVFGTVNEHRSKWVVMTDSSDSNAGAIRRVQTYDPDGNELTTVPFANPVPASSEFELWDTDMPPARIHDFINRSIESVTRRGVVPSTDSSHHFGGNIRTFALPATMVAVDKVQFRDRFTFKSINTADEVWSSVATNVTGVKDDEDYRRSASNKFTFAAGFSTGQVASDTMSAVDISGMTHVEFWAKSTDSTSADRYDLFLNDTSTEQVSFPALGSDTWTFVSLALANPESDTAITTVGINADSDPGTSTVWIDDVIAMREGSQHWETVNGAYWEVDRANRQIVFKPSFTIPYARIKISGFTKPSLLTTDTAQSDIDAEFIIARATAMALRARADRSADRREAAHLEAERQDALAEIHRNRMQLPRHARWVD